jgi:hypothetical protein
MKCIKLLQFFGYNTLNLIMAEKLNTAPKIIKVIRLLVDSQKNLEEDSKHEETSQELMLCLNEALAVVLRSETLCNQVLVSNK